MADMPLPKITDPVVRYRLDPGEPGVANPARARNSVYTVVGQESRNRARLKAEALRRGDQVLLVKTDYKVARTGSFNAVVGGTTTVITRARPEEARDRTPLEETRDVSNDRDAGADTEEKTLELRGERQRLTQQMQRLERETQGASPYAEAVASARMDRIELRLREIERELRILGAGRFGVDGPGGAGPARVSSAAGAFSATPDSGRRLLDLLV